MKQPDRRFRLACEHGLSQLVSHYTFKQDFLLSSEHFDSWIHPYDKCHPLYSDCISSCYVEQKFCILLTVIVKLKMYFSNLIDEYLIHEEGANVSFEGVP